MTRAWRLRAPLLVALAAALVAVGGARSDLTWLRPAANLGAPAKLTKDVPDLRQMQDLGRLPSSRIVTVALQLQDPQRAAEESLYRQEYTKGSPLYHRFLTPAQFAQRFGASGDQQSAVRGWLADGGLRVVFGGGTGRYWVARGPAAWRAWPIRGPLAPRRRVRSRSKNAAPRAMSGGYTPPGTRRRARLTFS